MPVEKRRRLRNVAGQHRRRHRKSVSSSEARSTDVTSGEEEEEVGGEKKKKKKKGKSEWKAKVFFQNALLKMSLIRFTWKIIDVNKSKGSSVQQSSIDIEEYLKIQTFL